jgi:anaerobic C4-dicarboxylate transporter
MPKKKNESAVALGVLSGKARRKKLKNDPEYRKRISDQNRKNATKKKEICESTS